MTTTIERGPMETWLLDDDTSICNRSHDINESEQPTESLLAFAREQDARLAACVAALEETAQWFHHVQHNWTNATESYRDCTVLPCQTNHAALRRARGETP